MISAMNIAEQIGSMSFDPEVKVGAIIINKDSVIISRGCNNFAKGVFHKKRWEDKILKKQIVIHAEINAIISAKTSLENCTLWVTYVPCPSCAAIIIQSGIKKVIAKRHANDAKHKDRITLTECQFREAGVGFYWHD